MSEYEVSIITATHRRPDFLKKCIIAIQQQTFENYEHIIVADHCPFAKKVYEEFKHIKNIKFFETDDPHINNVGAVSKNKGIEVAQSNYICYCDDDNILLPNHVQVLYEAIKNSKYDFVFSNMYMLDFVSQVLNEENGYRQMLELGLFNFSNYVSIEHGDMLCCIHSIEAIKKIGMWKPAEIVGRGEDTYLFQEIKEGKEEGNIIIGHVETPTCLYFTHNGSWGKSKLLHAAKKNYEKKLNGLKDSKCYVYPDLVYES